MKKFYLDVETTGREFDKHGIYQFSGMVEINDEIVKEFDFLMDPGDVEWSEYSEEMIIERDLSIGELPDQSIYFVEVLNLLNKYIDKFDKKDKFHIVAYNSKFDDGFFRAWFNQNNNRFYGAYFWPDQLDVMVLASFVLKDIRHSISNFSLENLCHLFGIDIDPHDAFSDIKATYHLYKALQQYYKIENFEI